jgi:hypothetical protein
MNTFYKAQVRSFRGLSINDILTNRGSWISNVQNGKFMSCDLYIFFVYKNPN